MHGWMQTLVVCVFTSQWLVQVHALRVLKCIHAVFVGIGRSLTDVLVIAADLARASILRRRRITRLVAAFSSRTAGRRG